MITIVAFAVLTVSCVCAAYSIRMARAARRDLKATLALAALAETNLRLAADDTAEVRRRLNPGD